MNKNKRFLSGTLSTIILAQLNQQGDMYGYEICQKVSELTTGEIELTEAAIYPALHKMEREGLITSYKEKVQGRTRKYYKLNAEKSSVIDLQIADLLRFSQNLKVLLNPYSV